MSFLGSSKLSLQQAVSLQVESSATTQTSVSVIDLPSEPESRTLAFANGNVVVVQLWRSGTGLPNDYKIECFDNSFTSLSETFVYRNGDTPEMFEHIITSSDTAIILYTHESNNKVLEIDNTGNVVRDINITGTAADFAVNSTSRLLEGGNDDYMISWRSAGDVLKWHNFDQDFICTDGAAQAGGEFYTGELLLNKFSDGTWMKIGKEVESISNVDLYMLGRIAASTLLNGVSNPAPYNDPDTTYNPRYNLALTDWAGVPNPGDPNVPVYPVLIDYTIERSIVLSSNKFMIFYDKSFLESNQTVSNDNTLYAKIFNQDLTVFRDEFKVAVIPFLSLRLRNLFRDSNDNVFITYEVGNNRFIRAIDSEGDTVLDPTDLGSDIVDVQLMSDAELVTSKYVLDQFDNQDVYIQKYDIT